MGEVPVQRPAGGSARILIQHLKYSERTADTAFLENIMSCDGGQ